MHGLRRALVLFALILGFVSQQTGATRLAEDECEEVGDVECPEEVALPCAPSCTDCTGCPGPARALVPAPAELRPATLATSDLTSRPRGRPIAVAPPRIDRPPCA